MALTKLSPCRGCCKKPQPDNLCPCFAGTLTATPRRDLIVSGVTMIFDPLKFGDINRTIPEVLPNDPFQLCGWSFREKFPPEEPFAQNTLQWNTFFTRNFQITNGPALPPGNKLVVQIFHDPRNDGGLIPFFGRGNSIAWFYEVLPDDVDGFSDCSLDFTSLIFLDQRDFDHRGDPVDDPETFDASGGTVTYSV